MVDPISESATDSKIGAVEGLSQASALPPANSRAGQEVAAQFVNLRNYLRQMQGMILDTEA